MNNQILPLLLVGIVYMLLASALSAQIPATAEEFREAAQLRRTFWEEFRHVIPNIPGRQNPENQNSENQVLRDRIEDFVEALQKQPPITDGGVANLILASYRSRFTRQSSEMILLFHDAIEVANIHEWQELTWRVSHNAGSIRISHFATEFLPIRHGFMGVLGLPRGWNSPFPREENPRITPIAVTFSRLGLYDLAWRVHMESGKTASFASTTLKQHWVQNSFYLFAAENAYRAGNKELAWSFLMLAAVFDESKFFESVVNTAQLWIDIEAGKTELPEVEIAQGERRKGLFLDIVNHYRGMNAHPRAWQFVKENKNEFDDPEGLIKETQDEWPIVVRRMLRTEGIRGVLQSGNREYQTILTLYGVQLFPEGHPYPDGIDPLDVRIPWAFSEGSVDEVKKRIDKLAEKCREDEKDDVRDWLYIVEGENTTRAKYISFVDDILTLERADGEKMILQFESLHPFDQNYTRRRMEVEKFEAEFGRIDFGTR